MTKKELAIANHDKKFNCAQAVACAFCDEADIDATGWAAGTYVLRVNGMYSGKMVVR